MDVCGRKLSTTQIVMLKNAYQFCLPIFIAKHNDLLKLCEDLAIPERYHNFYKAINSNNVLDSESDESKSDDDNDEYNSEYES